MGNGIVVKLGQLALALLALPSLSLAAPTLATRDEINLTSSTDADYLGATVTLDNGVTVFTQYLTEEGKEAIALAAKVGLNESLRLRGLPPFPTEPLATRSAQVNGGNSELVGKDLKTGRSTGLVKRRNSCGASTFENHSSGGSPFIDDCQAVANTAYGLDTG